MVLDWYFIVVVSFEKLSSVDDSTELASTVSLFRWVTGHIVVSFGFSAGCDSSSVESSAVSIVVACVIVDENVDSG